MAVPRLDFLGQDVVTGFLAQEEKHLAAGILDELAPLGFCRLSGRLWFGRSGTGWLQLLDCVLDQARGDFPATGLLGGLLPGEFPLFGF